ncbi:hypothetical protein [Bradyrhizobium sp. USDA 10063]
MNAEDHDNINADTNLMLSLSRTLTQETEVLFLGGNLDDYRIASEPNPYKDGPSGNEGAQPSAPCADGARDPLPDWAAVFGIAFGQEDINDSR